MYGSRSSAGAYRSAAIHSGVNLSAERKVALLLAGVVERIRLAETQIANGELGPKLATISNVLEIIEALRASLNFDGGGEIAENLSSIYTTAEARLVEANAQNDVAKLATVVRLLEPIRDAFAEVAQTTATAGAGDAGEATSLTEQALRA